MGQRIWSRGDVQGTAKGKTQDTFDDFVSGLTIKNISGLKLYGLQTLITMDFPTAGENGAPVLEINSSELGISEMKILGSQLNTDGIATNNKEVPFYSDFIPLQLTADQERKLGGATINTKISGTVTTTCGWVGAVALIYGNFKPDLGFELELRANGVIPPFRANSACAYMRAGISTASYTKFTANQLKILSSARTLTGLMGFVNPNAPTAEKNAVGLTKFISSEINDFQPQEWVFNIGWSASLGTPVGQPTPIKPYYHPTRFDLPQTSFYMDVEQIMAKALTNAGDGYAEVTWV